MNATEPLSIVPGTAAAGRLRNEHAPCSGRPLICRFFELDALPPDLAAQWTVLADAASEPNCFTERWFLEPSFALLAEQDDVRIAAVVSPDGLLAGLMPLTLKPSYGRLPIRTVQNWSHANSFLGTPIVRRGMETAFWSALLEALDETGWPRGLLHVSELTEHGPVLEGLRAASGAAGRPCDIVHRVRRALLCSKLPPQEYWETSVRKKKRKEIARLENRLAEQGEVRYATLGRSEDAGPWIEDFLRLEAQGWKGESGSALACDDRLADFFRAAVSGAHIADKLDFHRIDLDGRPLAMLVNFLSAPGGFSFKIAFDEQFARYSPGVLIERYNLRILDRRGIDWIDSCAAEDHPMIDSLWRERRNVVRVSVPLGGWRRRLLFHACRGFERSAGPVRRVLGKERRLGG